MAFRTVPVFTGVVGVDPGIALVATVQVPSESLCTALDDIVDHPLVGWKHGGSVSIQIISTELTENIGKLDHDRLPTQRLVMMASSRSRNFFRFGSVRWV